MECKVSNLDQKGDPRRLTKSVSVEDRKDNFSSSIQSLDSCRVCKLEQTTLEKSWMFPRGVLYRKWRVCRAVHVLNEKGPTPAAPSESLELPSWEKRSLVEDLRTNTRCGLTVVHSLAFAAELLQRPVSRVDELLCVPVHDQPRMKGLKILES